MPAKRNTYDPLTAQGSTDTLEEITEVEASQSSPSAHPSSPAAYEEPALRPLSPVEPVRPNYVDGKGMRELRVKRMTKVEEANLGGIVPFTIANFNPVIARVESGIIDYSVPPAGGKLGIQKRLKIASMERTAAILVVDKIKGYAKITQATDSTDDPNNPDVGYDWNVVQPIQQVREFDFQYNNPTDEFSMGGVLVFKGTWDTLARAARGENGGTIYVPDTKRAANGTLLYMAKPVSLVDRLTQILDRQKAYCMRKIQTAREYKDDPRPEFQASIDITHKTWGQYAVDRGWADLHQLDFLLLRNAGPGCKRCGASRQSGLAMFCKCGHPYDALAAYMAGHKVDIDLLASLPAEQLEQVKKEAKRRRELAALLEGDEKPTAI
jgi:hypothetical protein